MLPDFIQIWMHKAGGRETVKLTWDDLLIQDIADANFASWMQNWSDVVSGRIAPAFMNKFGVWFLRRPEGAVDMLDIFTGQVERVASSHEEFVANVNDRPWQEIYLLSKQVLALHEVGKIPGTGECYAIAPHPALGGPNPLAGDPLELRLVMTMQIGAWQSICGQVLRGNSPGEQ